MTDDAHGPKVQLGQHGQQDNRGHDRGEHGDDVDQGGVLDLHADLRQVRQLHAAEAYAVGKEQEGGTALQRQRGVAGQPRDGATHRAPRVGGQGHQVPSSLRGERLPEADGEQEHGPESHPSKRDECGQVGRVVAPEVEVARDGGDDVDAQAHGRHHSEGASPAALVAVEDVGDGARDDPLLRLERKAEQAPGDDHDRIGPHATANRPSVQGT
mmetsp:Transcript_15774/g.44947  ORF Transcript_15774/g.44947 Transcript_15774/m.44947 type:complete len:213 (-) Transcript_15774:681-1319(-)